MPLKSRLSTPDFEGLTCGDIVIQRISMSTLLERINLGIGKQAPMFYRKSEI
jgi:hypothetical protein